MTHQAGHAEGLLDSLRNLARTFIATLQTRLEIFASELDEQRELLTRIAVLAAVAAFCLVLAVMLVVLFIVVLFWDTNRLLAIGALAGVFSACGVIALLILRTAVKHRPRLLAATLAELRKDRSRLEEQ
ncbi:MAG: phage holin family protein [Burkholderiales bacterium]